MIFEQLSRHVFYPLWDLKDKSHKLEELARLQKSQWLSLEELQHRQWKKLLSILRYASDNSPYYKNLFDERGIKPDSIQSLADVQKIPVTTKLDVRNNLSKFISSEYQQENLVLAKTGGSTGVSLDLYFDEACQEARNAAAIRSDMWAGWSMGAMRAALWGNPPVPRTLKEKIRHHCLDRMIYLDTMLLNDQSMFSFVEQWKIEKPKAIFGLFEANTINDDDISIQKNGKDIVVFRTLRQQLQKKEGVANLALADFVAPKNSGLTDYLGTFCVAIYGADELVNSYKENHDDYNAILVQAIADRFAEAFAEYLHKQIRTKHWAYIASENLNNADLIKETYKGIRPAPGYPACPDHTEKATLWSLIEPDKNAGITITKSFAMLPTAAVSGFYFSHPDAKYFGTGKIQKDQVEDYAKRKGENLSVVERWLAPVLDYDV